MQTLPFHIIIRYNRSLITSKKNVKEYSLWQTHHHYHFVQGFLNHDTEKYIFDICHRPTTATALICVVMVRELWATGVQSLWSLLQLLLPLWVYVWEICNLRLIEFIAPLSEREGKDKKKNSMRQDSFFNGKKIVLGKYSFTINYESSCKPKTYSTDCNKYSNFAFILS